MERRKKRNQGDDFHADFVQRIRFLSVDLRDDLGSDGNLLFEMVSFPGIRGGLRDRLTVVQRIRDFVFGHQLSHLSEIVQASRLGRISQVFVEVRITRGGNGGRIIARIFLGGMDLEFIVPGKIRGLDRSLSDSVSELYVAARFLAARDRVIRAWSAENARLSRVASTCLRTRAGQSAHPGIRTDGRCVFLFLRPDRIVADLDGILSRVLSKMKRCIRFRRKFRGDSAARTGLSAPVNKFQKRN